MASVFYTISSGIALWSFEQGIAKYKGLSQTPTPESIELLPPQSPPSTFRNRDIPPDSYSPPLFDINQSEQFNLYRLAIGDGINVIVQDFPEFNFGGNIDPEGQIRVPFLGKISLVGLTLDEVQTKVAYELGQRYLQEEPEVIAALNTPRPVRLTVLGEVSRPGYYFFAPGVTVNNVLLGAGGSSPRADLRSVIVRRRLVDGTQLEEKVDLYSPLVEGKSLPEFRLQGGDTIIVSKLEAGQKDYDQNLISQTNLAQPAIIVRVLVPNEGSGGLSIRNLRLPNGSTFLDAVANLPPTIPLLNKQEVTLLRFDPEQGKVVTQGLNAIQTVQGLDVTQYVTLKDQDVIVVSRTLLGKVFAAFRILTRPIRDIFSFTSFFLNLADRFDNN
ncbi:MAG TPA: polysaccharide export protein [Cyanothece sp. UBA12306]|nr:polysaccharide export protein [Cyanothece sp. UBA12306]